jgi:hypothetical protein
MNESIKDAAQVMMANGGALGLTLTDCNEILQMISLILAIGFTLYKFKQSTK